MKKFETDERRKRKTINTQYDNVLGKIEDKYKDNERVLQFNALGLPILKRTGYGVDTRYWTNKGGIQAHYNQEKRKRVQAESADELMAKYPDCCYKIVRKNGIVDLRFKKP